MEISFLPDPLSMKITDCQVFVSCPARNFVTLKLVTDNGLVGWGDATLNGRELAVASYLRDHLCPLLVGRDVMNTEDTWQYFYKGAYWRRGPITMTAIGAIDMALWDLKGKALETPVYNLLGGRSRQKLRVYTHANGTDLESTLAAIARTKEKGYTAIRVQSGVPGLGKIYGVAGDSDYEPATKGDHPDEEEWATEPYLNYVPKLFAAVRDEFGPDLHLLHDAHHRLTPIEAARLARELEPYHLFWLEDTVAAENQAGFRLIREKSVTPLAVGEVFNTLHDCQQLISEQWIDYLRMTVSHGGGLTPMMKIAHFAEPFHVKTGCHGPSDISPVAMAACLHFGTAINNFGIQEYMGYADATEAAFSHDYRYRDGFIHLGDAPGLGVEFDESTVASQPYDPAYLPVNRLEDGTMFNW